MLLPQRYFSEAHTTGFIIPNVKIVRRDWLTKVGHSIMYTGEMYTGKMSIVLTGDA